MICSSLKLKMDTSLKRKRERGCGCLYEKLIRKLISELISRFKVRLNLWASQILLWQQDTYTTFDERNKDDASRHVWLIYSSAVTVWVSRGNVHEMLDWIATGSPCWDACRNTHPYTTLLWVIYLSLRLKTSGRTKFQTKAINMVEEFVRKGNSSEINLHN